MTFVTLIRPIPHLAVTTAPAPQPRGAGDAYTHPPARRRPPMPARLPARLPPPRRVTGRHPPPPPRRPLEVCPCPHPATRPGSRPAWPRSAGTSCRCPRPANGHSATVPPAAPRHGIPAHLAGACPCLPAGGWCHGVRAATTDPATIAAWWRRQPRAVPGVAAGPSGLVLVDIDAHGSPPPPTLATGLLPGIDLAAEPIPREVWDDPARFRDGRDTLALLARLRGGPRPWPTGPEHQPVTAATPSGGAHLWYRAPAPNLRQALSDPHGRYGLAWQIDLKAGWSYGIAPGATTTAGTYRLRGGDPAHPGRMPAWLALEVIRATTTAPRQPVTPPPYRRLGGPGPAAYLATVIGRGANQLAALTDGRKRALSALAYHAGGLLAWSGADRQHITGQLIDAGTAAGLRPNISARIVNRAITNGINRPVTPSAAS